MVEGLSPKWREFQQAVYRRADQLTQPYSNARRPIPLSKLVHMQRIARVKFDEMAVDGGLIVNDDGFEVHVSCNRSEIDVFARIFMAAKTICYRQSCTHNRARDGPYLLYQSRAPAPKSLVGRHSVNMKV